MGWRAPGETQDLNQKPRLEEVLSLTSGFCLLLLLLVCTPATRNYSSTLMQLAL